MRKPLGAVCVFSYSLRLMYFYQPDKTFYSSFPRKKIEKAKEGTGARPTPTQLKNLEKNGRTRPAAL